MFSSDSFDQAQATEKRQRVWEGIRSNGGSLYTVMDHLVP
jgi:hypothetical protein